MAFNPILETNIQPTQTVQQPSAANSALSLIGGLFPERPKANPPSRSDVTDDLRQETLRAMETARQAGDTAGINNAYRNWSVQQGVGTAPEVDSAFEAYTGRSAITTTTGGDNSVSRLRSDPSYTMGFELARTSMPDATPEQLDAEALNYASSRMSNQARLDAIKQNKDVTWAEAQVTYDEGFNLAVKTARDMASAINADQVITPQEAQEFRSFFATEMEKFDAPPGVDATTWDTYQKQKMGAFNDLINTQLNNLMSDGPSKDMPKAMQNLFDKLVTQGKLPAGIMYAVSGGGSNQAALDTMLQLFAGGQESWAEKITEVSNMSFEELLAYSKTYEETGVEVFENALSAEKISQWRKQPDATIVGSLVEERANISSADPMIATLGVQAIVEKVSTLEGKSLDGDLLARTFDTSFFNALERIKTKNPALGEYFLGRTNEVLKAQQAAMLANITAVANANGFTASTVNGVADFRPDPKLVSAAAQKEVDTFFGGDWNKAWAANGRKVGGVRGSQNFTPELSRTFDQIKGLKKSIDQYAAVMTTVDRINGVEPKPEAQAEPVAALGTDFRVPESVAQDTEFLSAVTDSSTRLQIQPDWLLRVIDFETASTWSPQIKNPGSTATGLIQFLESTAKGLGTTTSDLASMTRGQQMAYVEKYLEPYKGRLNNFGDVYMAVHWPAGIGKDEGYVMYKKGSAEYDVNKNLDSNGDGTVTRGETLARVLGATGTGNAVPYTQRPYVGATNTFAPLAAAGESAPMTSPAAPSPAPSVSGTSYQPTQPMAPEATPTVSNSNPEAGPPAAKPVAMDPEMQEFIKGLKKGRQEFASMADLEAAKAAGEVKEGDIVFVGERPVIVQ